ncbi:MAG TPA: phosphomannomutase/phosphoglucomutase [Pyrinomonadaceae bacterium]|nr:phosphomannomutase/phosphoglucomutase [Pyrinomonadaceae bacterium]
MNWDVFRAYDIRGVYPTDIDEEAYYRIAKAYVYLFKPKSMVVGMDARSSSPPLKASLIRGFLDAGVDVIDIGEITTDMLYYAVGAYDYSGGIVVSASHNPKEYNGMKMVREKAAAISSDTGLFDIRDTLKAGKDAEVKSDRKGTCTDRDIVDDYLKHVLKSVDQNSIKQFTLVANGNFGYVCRPATKLAEQLGLNLITLNFEPDGTFPKGPPDPMLPGNRTETEALIKERGATFGVAWDADADRCMFFTEKGEFISGAYITALLADILLTKYGSDNRIIFDPRVIWPTLDAVKRRGGTPIISKGGHAFMKDRMRKEDSLFAGEMSGHYYFRENFYADNGIIPFLLILEHLSKEDKPFSEIIAPYTAGHYMSGELNYRVEDIKSAISRVREKFRGQGEEDFTDGYSLETPEWRFNIRSSNTEPLLRLNIEARKAELVGQMQREIENLISGSAAAGH